MASTASGNLRPIVVVGSLNMDLVYQVARLPRPGETLAATSLEQIPGGKGANQAVAVARLGYPCVMIGCVGSDGFGNALLGSLKGAGVQTELITRCENVSSGVALIGVEHSGQNSIAIVPGANGELSPDRIRELHPVIANAAALIVQLEVPQATVAEALRIAREHRVLTVLDPAPVPASGLDPALFPVDVFSPNQSEAEALTGIHVDDVDSAREVVTMLHRRGAKSIVLKLGELGAFLSNPDYEELIQPPEVTAIDTTAAGDAFTAALTVTLCEGRDLIDATRWACVAGALATTQRGAQPAMPSRQAVARFFTEFTGDLPPSPSPA